MAASQAILLLQKQLRDLCKNPVDGFSAGLVDETDMFEWSVSIIGPPDTLYDGGFFNAIMSFPKNYPNSPPTVRFTSEMWHPNVYPDGKVCISILHPPGDDPNGYELATERWSPVHTVCDAFMHFIFFGCSIYVCVCKFLAVAKYIACFLSLFGLSYKHGWDFGLITVFSLCLHLLRTLRSCTVKSYQPYVFFFIYIYIVTYMTCCFLFLSNIYQWKAASVWIMICHLQF
ncbi:hypothetical protein BDE02_10G184200 [Populus trichocarpa]|nr:hypothetical protein BDE02_10G184200 [Populus trichocarpa]